jgi:hypothetical protein
MNAQRITDLALAAYHGDANAQARVTRVLVESCSFHESLIADVKMLENALKHGQLDIRADPAKYSSEYGEIIRRMNATLDAVIGPLKMSIEYTDQLSRGILPTKITGTYHGEVDRIKNNLNNCIDTFNALGKGTGSSIQDTANEVGQKETADRNFNFSEKFGNTTQVHGDLLFMSNQEEMSARKEAKDSQMRMVITWGDKEYEIDEFRSMVFGNPEDTLEVGRDGTGRKIEGTNRNFNTECQVPAPRSEIQDIT